MRFGRDSDEVRTNIKGQECALCKIITSVVIIPKQPESELNTCTGL